MNKISRKGRSPGKSVDGKKIACFDWICAQQTTIVTMADDAIDRFHHLRGQLGGFKTQICTFRKHRKLILYSIHYLPWVWSRMKSYFWRSNRLKWWNASRILRRLHGYNIDGRDRVLHWFLKSHEVFSASFIDPVWKRTLKLYV